MMHRSGLLIAVALLSGCATLFSESTQQVHFTSKPEGAEVILDGQPIGRTPLTHTIDRSTFDRHIVVVRSDGYQVRQFELSKGLNTIALINLSSGTFWLTDAASGNMIEYSPSAYYLELVPASNTASAQMDPAERAVLHFVLVNHRTLLTEIARGDGEHLRLLAGLLRVDKQAYRPFAHDLQGQADRLLAHQYPYYLYQDLATTGERYRATASLSAPAPAAPTALRAR
jgi:hypothetical protein